MIRRFAAAALLVAACDRVAPPPSAHELTVVAAGKGRGTVTSSPAGIDCAVADGVATGQCRASFDVGRAVALRATADSTSTFAGWADPCAAGDDCRVVMTMPRAVTSRFSGPRLRVVTDSLNGVFGAPVGDGSVLIVPGNVTCAIVGNRMTAPCEAEFAPGVPIAVTIDPAPGQAGVTGMVRSVVWPNVVCGLTGGTAPAYRFVCAGVPSSPGLDVRVALNRTQLTLNASPTATSTARGRVTSDVGGIDCTLLASGLRSGICSADLPLGTIVTLSFAPEPGTVFQRWGAECPASPLPRCTLVMDRARRAFSVMGIAL